MIKTALKWFYALSAENGHKRRQNFIQTSLEGLPSGSRLIDVGAGTARYKQFCNHLNYTSQDFCQYDGAGDGKGFQSGDWDTQHIDIVSEITSIPVEDSSFDSALCTDVLEHVPNPNATIQELRRIVKPGGKIIITVPTQCDAHQTPYFFSGGYSNYFFAKVFTECNVEISYESGYFETVDQKIFLGLKMLHKLSREKYRYFLHLGLYIILITPVFLLLRSLPKFDSETGNNGILVIASNDK